MQSIEMLRGFLRPRLATFLQVSLSVPQAGYPYVGTYPHTIELRREIVELSLEDIQATAGA